MSGDRYPSRFGPFTPKRAGDRRKTDKRDAVKLAGLYRAGELTAIRIPDEVEEQVRSLVRCRETMMREILKSRHYVLKLLQCRGLVFRNGKNWTQRHWAWLRKLELEGEDRITFETYLDLLEYKLVQRDTLDQQIERIAFTGAYREPVARLRSLRGIATLTAMILVSEIGDIRRFASPRQLMGYLGLTVSETSSGGIERRGGITKTGNAHVRHVLVEAAWTYRHPARKSALLQRRARRTSEAVQDIAWQAQKRLCSRYWTMQGRGKLKVQVCTAIARELAGFIWAIGQTLPSPAANT